QARDVLAVEKNTPRRGAQHAGQTVEESAFPCAIRSDDGADFAALDFEVDSVKGGQTAETDGQGLGAEHLARSASLAGLGRGWLLKSKIGWHLRELAGWREDRLLLWNRLEDLVLAILHVEDELADEGLVILLAQHLVALREVVTFFHFESLERLAQLHRVFASAALRFLHAELQGINGLIVRLDVTVG